MLVNQKIEILTQDDIKQQLEKIKAEKELRELRRSQKILVCTAGATAVMGTIRLTQVVSPVIDKIFFTKLFVAKKVITGSYVFMGLIPIPNYYFIILALVFVVKLLIAIKVDFYSEE